MGAGPMKSIQPTTSQAKGSVRMRMAFRERGRSRDRLLPIIFGKIVEIVSWPIGRAGRIEGGENKKVAERFQEGQGEVANSFQFACLRVFLKEPDAADRKPEYRQEVGDEEPDEREECPACRRGMTLPL